TIQAAEEPGSAPVWGRRWSQVQLLSPRWLERRPAVPPFWCGGPSISMSHPGFCARHEVGVTDRPRRSALAFGSRLSALGPDLLRRAKPFPRRDRRAHDRALATNSG